MKREPREVNAVAMLRQSAAGAERMQKFDAFVKSIGCTVAGDEIFANAEQMKEIALWWSGQKHSSLAAGYAGAELRK